MNTEKTELTKRVERIDIAKGIAMLCIIAGHLRLGKIETDAVDVAMFIPPASPAIKKTLGVLTTNGKMIVCSSERKLSMS